ncbi:MAG: hypothetical protein OIF58_14330, partial [Cohaesibacter sp.]|nr:hypothetical protein [Cohaesibacter sp.]
MLKPTSGLSQIQDKPSKSLDQIQPNITNLRKNCPKHKRLRSQTSHDKTKTYKNKLRHDKILGGMKSYGFMHGEAWARPGQASKRASAKPGEAHHIARI